jgi:hypothetical protein
MRGSKWLKEQREWLSQVAIVLGTWVIALVSLFSSCSVKDYMHKQIEEMKRSTNLQYRPFASVVTEERTCSINYKFRDYSKSIEEVEIGSPEYDSAIFVSIDYERQVTLENKGSTPLWLKSKVLASAMLENEWLKKYNGSEYVLIDSIRAGSYYDTVDVDIVIEPGGSDPFSSAVIPKFMSVEQLEHIRDGDHRLVLYPYVYFEYKDFTEHIYNIIRIDYVIFNISAIENKAHIKTTQELGKKRLAWDIDLPPSD